MACDLITYENPETSDLTVKTGYVPSNSVFDLRGAESSNDVYTSTADE